MYLEGITVCIGFGDYLAETLLRNRPVVNRMIVVTEEKDTLTRRVAKASGCRIVLTNRHREDGAKFNKGKAINDGLAAAHYKGWLLYLDADIALPVGFRRELDRFLKLGRIRFDNNPYENKNKPKTNHFNVVYGASRVNCPGISAWYEYLETGEYNWPLEKLRANNSNSPPGYFQLWCALADATYPEDRPTASASDLAFARQFPYRIFLPFTVLHLGQHGRVGEDHTGRKSKPWSGV